MPPQTILANATPTSGSNNSNGITSNSNEMHGSGDSNNNDELKSNKLKQPVSSQQLNETNLSRSRSPIPSLQWPWNRAGAHSATIAGQGQCKNAGNSTVTNIPILKKRNSSGSVDSAGLKRPRLSNVSQDNLLLYNVNSGASKRLKAAALEESQTKITGYFKSQMKGQIHSSINEKKIEESTTLLTEFSSSTSIKTPLLIPSGKTTEIVNTQIVKNLNRNKERQQSKTATFNNICQKNNISFFAHDSGKFLRTIDQKSYFSSSFSLSNTHKTNHLQKLEKSKTTKIAQVAPNLRKTPVIQNISINNKSPKKPVAIAPRTPEVKLQQLQPKTETPPLKQKNTPHKQNQQKAVLLTAIHLPGHPLSTTSKTSQTTPKLLQNAETSLPSSTNNIAAPANSTLFQLPSVQIPNLVQFPQLITSNGANVVQIPNFGGTSVAKTVASTATTASNTTHAGSGQYIFNGTLFKLQQYTSATTTASAISASTTANQYSFLTPSDVQLLLSKQHQQKLGSCNPTATPGSNVQDLLQQQILAAIANQQQPQFHHLQTLSNPNLQQSPLFMATPTGVLLNATSLPVVFAQTPGIASNSQQDKSSQLATPNTSQFPTLHSFQSSGIPALSPIFPSNANQQDNNDITQPQLQSHQLAQISLPQPQFLSTTQPPPLSAVTITSLKNASNLSTINSNNNIISAAQNNIKLCTTKPNFVTSSQPPPLITISTLKTRISPSHVASKQILTKACQKRNNKSLDQSVSLSCSKGKITAGGMVIATSTTPPPLVPTSSSSVTPTSKDLSQIRVSNSTVSVKPIVQTPSLVSFSIPSLKKAQSLMSTFASINSISEPAISPKNITELDCTSTSINVVPYLSSSDLFDVVKNDITSIATPSNGLNSALLTYTPSTLNNTTTKYTHPMISNESKIKNEIIENMTDVSSDSVCSIKSKLETERIKQEPITVGSVKGELNGIDFSSTDEITQTSSSMSNECSSSSFNSHSISSTTDLSLEASTSTSRSSSVDGKRQPEPEHKQSTTALSLLTHVPLQYNSNYCPVLSNKSALANDCSSQQILDDPSNLSRFIASDESDEFKSLKTNENSNCKTPKRHMPSPESGISSSLSNSECGNSDENSTESITSIKDSTSLHVYNSLLSNPNKPSSAAYGDCNSNDSSPYMSSCINDVLSTATKSLIANMTHISGPISLAAQSSLKPASLTIIDTKLSEVSLKCAISPILSQPKTIRFPAESGYGVKGGKRHDGVCYWDKCNKKHDNNSKLLDHMQCFHVNSQNGPFVCLWVGCKVYNKKSCSRRWLERHVLSHGGSKQFKCIVEGCGLRFGSQLALQKHVNNHFTATDNKEQNSKRTNDPPVPKQLRKNGKKLRYRRQPFSARMFDFFDAGIMEGLQHRLRQINTLTNGSNSITFHGYATMRRKTLSGVESYVKWSPAEIIPDEWVPDSIEPFIKTVNIKALKPAEKTKVESLLTNAYKLRYSSNLFKNTYYLSDKYYRKKIYESNSDENNTDTHGDSGSESDGESFSEKTIYKPVLTIAKYKEPRKHLRKPRKYNTI